MKKLKTFDSSYFRGKVCFENDGIQNYLVFQPIHRYFVGIKSNPNSLLEWKSKGLSNESVKVSRTGTNFFGLLLDYLGNKKRLKFCGSCLKQDKVTYNHGKIVNIYIAYEVSKNKNISSLPTLNNCLFGAVSLTESADIDEYK